MNTYPKQSLPNLRGEFRDPSAANLTADEVAAGGRLFDPTGPIRFRLVRPDKTTVTYVFGTDVQLVRDSLGKYRVQFQLTQVGDYWYRFESDTQISAGEKTVRVPDTLF